MAARVLIATDGSKLAADAARRAATLLGGDTAYVVLAVVETSVPLGGLDAGMPAPVAADPALIAEGNQVAEDDARVAADTTAALFGPTTRTRVEHGDAGSSICAFAHDENVDLVVVGSHGSGVIKRVLLGSVSHHVLHHAPCPVLVVRDPSED